MLRFRDLSLCIDAAAQREHGQDLDACKHGSFIFIADFSERFWFFCDINLAYRIEDAACRWAWILLRTKNPLEWFELTRRYPIMYIYKLHAFQADVQRLAGYSHGDDRCVCLISLLHMFDLVH